MGRSEWDLYRRLQRCLAVPPEPYLSTSARRKIERKRLRRRCHGRGRSALERRGFERSRPETRRPALISRRRRANRVASDTTSKVPPRGQGLKKGGVGSRRTPEAESA